MHFITQTLPTRQSARNDSVHVMHAMKNTSLQHIAAQLTRKKIIDSISYGSKIGNSHSAVYNDPCLDLIKTCLIRTCNS